ncbi:hypothetical protein NLG97_g2282 [Lecanicillium saksenae]|uniref:Uncharacterized protein n=1 Tax=Lecanicillium saksenae TaxID=468837 RepID=A0ACC1R5D8_9HYPO|nr:hypothetical protein NLG97_g2282 [Lecanicillium saksenae]
MMFSVKNLLLSSLAVVTTSGHAMRASSPLDVKIKRVGNTLIKTTVTNTGDENIRFVETASIIDSVPVQKVEAFSDGKPLQFKGIYVNIDPKRLEDANFRKLNAHDFIEAAFDLADLYDVSMGGDFTLFSRGGFMLGESSGHNVTGYASYTSNVLSIHVEST